MYWQLLDPEFLLIMGAVFWPVFVVIFLLGVIAGWWIGKQWRMEN
jgi:hypothetical protein